MVNDLNHSAKSRLLPRKRSFCLASRGPLTAPDEPRAFRTQSHTRARPRQPRLSRPINRVPVADKKVLDADLNGDGNVDFVTSNLNGGNVSVRVGNGSGAFTGGNTSDYAVQSQPFSVITGDFNKDGMPDIAASNAGSSSVSILLQRCQ